MPTSSTISTSEHRKTGTNSTRFVTLCGRIIRANPDYFPRAEYRGKTIHFCTDSCLETFLTDPDAFYKAHRKPEKKNTTRRS